MAMFKALIINGRYASIQKFDIIDHKPMNLIDGLWLSNEFILSHKIKYIINK